ncbi:MAG TPA: MnmC family methyltransferase, partial [Bacteroidia bacterium]|nr:MnmC family methyltransferase [Bacteroidia bacterium]
MKIEVKDGFVIEKINADFLEFKSKEIYNLVYLDAFAPTTQNELWQVEVLHKIFHMMAPQGILVTYCAKGELKRNLKSVGFIVETL